MATRFWVLSNEDSRANIFRKTYAENNEGNWVKTLNNGWIWESKVAAKQEIHQDPVVKEEIHQDPVKIKPKLFRKKNKDSNDK